MRSLERKVNSQIPVGLSAFSVKWNIVLPDVGTEELGHFELLAALARQLTKNLSAEELARAGLSDAYVEHTCAPCVPCAPTFFAKGDPITDLHECLAAEQRARTSYDNALRLMDDPGAIDVLRFLRARELVHYQRFGEPNRTRWQHNSGERVADENGAIPGFADNQSQNSAIYPSTE